MTESNRNAFGLFGTVLFVLGKFAAMCLSIGWLLNEEWQNINTLFYITVALYFAVSGLWYLRSDN